ncbi:Clp protease N-terminal domain-containing protein [Nocardiopsis changdeensis]|uniref:Clp protease N-terminal domain-containing protein n=1 Tax=Nocardiopsis changdeensis TaxID=2831969 RepID=UPI003F4749CD
MPKVNVYLPEDLAEAVRESRIPVSAVCQRALEQAVRRLAAAREALRGPVRGRDLDAHLPLFTPRARTVLRLAADRPAPGTPITTADLAAALVQEGGNLALHVLGAMEITPAALTAALAGCEAAEEEGPSAPPAFSSPAVHCLEAALGEATALGHNYVGCEHLLLGLVAEEEGAGGAALRSLGADPRATRRAVTAALAGYVHLRSQQAADPGQGPADALEARLTPLLARIERLEERLDTQGRDTPAR